jgi:hypothetical protein
MTRKTVFANQRERMLKLLEIAYALRELGYLEEATGIFRTAAKEGEAGLKSGMQSNKIDQPNSPRWRKPRPGPGKKLRPRTGWKLSATGWANGIIKPTNYEGTRHE